MKGSYRQMARLAPEQGPEICTLQQELCTRKGAVSGLPKPLGMYEVMSVWAGQAHSSGGDQIIDYQPTAGRFTFRFCAMSSRLLSKFLMLHNDLKSQLLLSLGNVMNPT